MNINEPRHGGGFVIPFVNTAKKHRPSTRPGSLKSNRIPFLNWIPDQARNHFVATSAEYAGTTLFLFFAFSGTQVALLASPPSSENVVGTPSDPSQLMYIALSFGFSLAVNAWVFFRISGGLFNPAVTLGMCLVGALPYIRGLFLVVAQILGGITAAAICDALFPGPLTVRTNLGGGTSVVQGLFIEMFLSAELVFTIFMLAAEKHKGTFIAPIGIGLSLFIAELTGVYFTGGSVNPARSFGPSLVAKKFHTYHWIYWVGPILGALLASGFYKFIKMLEYETANPGQDRAHAKGEHFNPDLDTSHPRVSFAPDDYAMEEGNSKVMANGRIGTPQEYGSKHRPFSDSPAPPHPNDQFTGLHEGGMHASELVKPVHDSTDSDHTLHGINSNASTLHNGNRIPFGNPPSNHSPVLHQTEKPMPALYRPDSIERKRVGSMADTAMATNTTRIPTSPTNTGAGHKVSKSSLKPGTTSQGIVEPRQERSVKANTYNNRNMITGPRDEAFFDKE